MFTESMWFEDETRYRHIHALTFGVHALYDFEVYRDLKDNSIVAVCHDDPEEIVSLNDLAEFAEQYDDDSGLREWHEFIRQYVIEDILLDHR